MKRNTRIASFTLALAAMALTLAVGTLQAQEKIDEKRSVKADASIRIENLSGLVIVKGWKKNEVKIEGTLGKGAERLDIRGDEEDLVIEVIIPDNAKHVEGSNLEIQVPQGGSIEVAVVSADVAVSGLANRLRADTVSGDIEVESKLKDIGVNSVSGDIDLKVEAEDMEVQCVSGDISLEGFEGGELSINSVSGDMEIAGASLERISTNSVSGDVEFKGNIARSGKLNSQSGDIILIFTGKVNAEFDISTFSGDIENAFGPEPKSSSKYTPGKTLRFTEGDGDARIRIESFSGEVGIEKK